MTENGKITDRQLILLIFISRIVIVLTYLPALYSPPANQDVWISVLLSIFIELLLAYPLYLLYKRFPDQSIIQYSQTIFGIAGKLIGLLFVWFFIHIALVTLGQFEIFIVTTIMPETPHLFVIISMLIFCAYATSKGIEVLGRSSEIISVILMISIISIFMLLIKDMDFRELTPMFEKGISPIISGSFTIATRTVEVLGLAMILPKLNDMKKAKRVLIVGYSLITLFFILVTIAVLAVFGADEAKSRAFPFFSATRFASIGDFFERIESIHMGAWISGTFIKVSFYYYLAVLGLSQIFNLKSYKSLIIPVGALIVPLCILIAPSIVELRKFTSYKVYTWYALFFIFIIPIILLIVALIRKKGARLK